MAQSNEYTSLLERRTASVFSKECQTALMELGERLSSPKQRSHQRLRYRELMDEIDPYQFRRAASEVRDLVWHKHAYRSAADRIALAKRVIEKEPDLAFLYIFDHNGYIREIAIERARGPLRNAFEVIAIVDACNNWVPQVRSQATKAMERCLPVTPGAVLANAFAFVQENARHWARWETGVFDEASKFFESDVVISAVLDQLISGEVRGPSKTLAFAMQFSTIDENLLRLFNKADQASVRAQALKTMLYKRAVWKTGYEYEWIDKPLGKRRRVASISSRNVKRPFDTELLISQGIQDRHIAVRRVAAQAIIDLYEQLDKPTPEIIERMLTDKCSAIRSRGEYLKSQMDGVDT